MSDRDATLALVCWFVAIPLQLWTVFGGPRAAGWAGVVCMVLGLFLFTAWATAGGMPPGMVR